MIDRWLAGSERLGRRFTVVYPFSSLGEAKGLGHSGARLSGVGSAMTLVFQECSRADQGSSGMRFLSLTGLITEGIEGFGPFIVGEKRSLFLF